MKLRARKFEFQFPQPTLIMGIVNVTPDSFSDGGRYLDPQTAIRHALDLVAEGADIVDVGGESTRPGAVPVSAEYELRRVIPVIKALVAEVNVPVSIDTMKPEVAQRAIEAGASMVNDVGASRNGAEMWRLVAETGAAYVAMHMQGEPRTMQQQPHYENVVAEVNAFFGGCLERLAQAGVAPEQTILDVGIGFGKTPEHNLELLGEIASFARWGRPLLLGASRKSFLGHLLGVVKTEERLPASLACAIWAARAGVTIIRTHDVAATRQAVRMTEVLEARRGSPAT